MSLPIALVTLQQPAALAQRPRRYVMPTAQGAGTGESWADAAGIASINAQVNLLPFGGDVLLRADAGAYPETTRDISYGGMTGSRVNIIGVDVNGLPMHAEFVGSRARPYSPSGAKGNVSGTFRILSGADHLGLSWLKFTDCGWCIRVGADVADLLVEDCLAYNVRTFFLTAKSGAAVSATVSGLTIRRCEAHGYSKNFALIRYDSHAILIEDCLGDSEFQDLDPFAFGIAFNDTAHDWDCIRCVMENHRDTSHGTGYWNSDAFASERTNDNGRFIDCIARHNTDRGFDLKGRNTYLLRCVAEDNKRNYCLWSSALLEQCIGRDPAKPPVAQAHLGGTGGSGGTAQIAVMEGGFCRAVNCTFEQTAGAPFYVEKTGFLGIDTITEAQTTRPGGLSYTDGSTDAQFVVFSTSDTVAPTISSATALTLAENLPGNFPFTLSKPGIIEIVGGADAAQFFTEAKRLRSARQDYEAPIHPSNQLVVTVRARDANNNLSAPVIVTLTITDAADDPLPPLVLINYTGGDGGYWRIRPEYVWADVAMTMPAEIGGPVAAVTDLFEKGRHAYQDDPLRQGYFQTNGAGRFWIELDGYDDYYKIGGPGAFRFPQLTGIMVVDRDDEDTARRYLGSYPRSTSATSFNAVWAWGTLETQTVWARSHPSNVTGSSGGAPRNRAVALGYRSTDLTGWSNGSKVVDGTDTPTLSYAVAAGQARLFADGNPTPGGFFKGRWYDGAIWNEGASDSRMYRVTRDLGGDAGIALA